jgi:hypothetical protein
MAVRLAIQPIIATALALRDGLRDAKQNRPPYALALFLDSGRPGHRLRDGWKSIRTVFCVALVADVVYQLLQLDWVYVGEALVVAQIVTLVPYRRPIPARRWCGALAWPVRPKWIIAGSSL